MTNRLSESEFMALSGKLNKQRQNLDQIIQQVNSAITGADWRSTAAEDYKARWSRNRSVLTKLAQALTEWSNDLKNRQAPAAHELNRRPPGM